MAIDRDSNLPGSGSTMPPRDSTMRDSTMYERDTLDGTDVNTPYDRDGAYDRDGGGSNFLAFLIGGVIIAIGLLAFLFYDGGSGRDVSTTSSTTPRIEAPASPGSSSTPAPSRPANPQ